MSKEPDNLADNLLDRATPALRDTVLPDGPPSHVIARTLASLETGPSNTNLRRAIPMKTLLRIAASLLVVCALAYLVLQSLGTSSLALGDVIDALRNTHSARYKQTMTISMPGQPPDTVDMNILMVEDGWMRSEGPGGIVAIADFRQRKTLSLDPQRKSATIMEMSNLSTEKGPVNPIKQLQGMDVEATKNAKSLGRKEIEGHQTEGFEFAYDLGTTTVWVDVKTRLPVQIHMISKSGGVIPGAETISHDFVWNPPVDQSLLSLTPPAGYQLRNLKMDMSKSTEQDLVTSLSLLAQMNQNRFPDDYGMAPMMQSIEARKDELTPAEKTELAQKLMTIARGFVFVGIPGQGTDWHYAGAGVQFGQADHPIFWYLPAGASNYRVINGDMSVHDVAPADLPSIPSKRIVNPAKMDGATSRPQ